MASPQCIVPACERLTTPKTARGLCGRHYKRLLVHGDPLGGGPDHRAYHQPCEVGDCAEEARARGMCGLHYDRRARLGRVDLPSAEERFWKNVSSLGLPGCWEWQAGRHPSGTGRLRAGYAPRIAWEYTQGPIPEGMQINHHCDNPPCVRIDHLYVGTQQDNMDDMVGRERGWWQKGQSS